MSSAIQGQAKSETGFSRGDEWHRAETVYAAFPGPYGPVEGPKWTYHLHVFAWLVPRR